MNNSVNGIVAYKKAYEYLNIDRDELRSLIREAISLNKDNERFLVREKVGKNYKNFISIEFLPILEELLKKRVVDEVQEEDIEQYTQAYWAVVEKYEKKIEEEEGISENPNKDEIKKAFLNMEVLDSIIVSASVKKFIEFYKKTSKITEAERNNIRDIVYRQLYPKFKKYITSCIYGVQEVDKKI